MQRLDLASPDALIAAVPHLLGFAPSSSVVVLWFRHGRLVLTQRLDAVEGAPAEWIAEATAHGLRAGCDAVLVIGFRERGDAIELPGARAVRAIEERAAEAGCELLDALLVDDGRWWSYRCTDACCPEGGRILDPRIALAVQAAFVADGSAPLPDRAALVAAYAPDPSAVRRVGSALEHVAADGPSADAALAALLDGRVLTAPEIAAVIAAVVNVGVRDALLWRIAALPDSRPLGAALAEAVRSAPARFVAPIASVAAIAAWLSGDGARATACVDRALVDQPGYGLARLVSAALAAGMPPELWRDAMRGLTEAECRTGRPG